MTFFTRIFARLAPNYCHCRTCPDTIESIAQDFVENHLPPIEAIQEVINTKGGEPSLAWRRRISSIYGVSTCIEDPRGRVAEPGWNDRLWRRYPGTAPEELVAMISQKAKVLLQVNSETAKTALDTYDEAR